MKFFFFFKKNTNFVPEKNQEFRKIIAIRTRPITRMVQETQNAKNYFFGKEKKIENFAKST